MTTRRSLSPTLSMVALAVLVAGFAAACSGASGTASLAATCADFEASPEITQTAELKVGGEATVTLCSNPSTGFAWDGPVVADPDVVAVVATGYREPQETPPVVGASGTDLITIKGTAAGTTTVTLTYSQPWDGGQKAAWTYEVTVTVK